MKRGREDAVAVAVAVAVPVSLSLSLGAAVAVAEQRKRRRRRGGADAGGGEFVCKTCSRGFASFQALGGHRTSHLRGRQGLALGLDAGKAAATAKKSTEEDREAASTGHRCHVCGVGFEMGQALGGHMRRHREEAAAGAAASPPHPPLVLLELFV